MLLFGYSLASVQHPTASHCELLNPASYPGQSRSTCACERAWPGQHFPLPGATPSAAGSALAPTMAMSPARGGGAHIRQLHQGGKARPFHGARWQAVQVVSEVPLPVTLASGWANHSCVYQRGPTSRRRC